MEEEAAVVDSQKDALMATQQQEAMEDSAPYLARCCVAMKANQVRSREF